MLPADVAVRQRLWYHRSSTAWTHQENASLSEAMVQRRGFMISLSFDSLRSSIGLIKEARAFSKPWFKGEDYDLSLFRFS
jgi:hypothetical protein